MKETNLLPFHLAIPVHDLEKSRDFYKNILGCDEGRSSDHWVDFNLFGHQLVIHYKEKSKEKSKTNPVDGKDVPIPHFGVILEWNQFHNFSNQLIEKGITFIIDPYIRFKGLPGEQATMFFKDPCGNALEFKSFKDFNQIFEK
jgi:extradiol dioxygenase family protein|tara:strand:+ start:165 stop:593 length:429 start_codon:yes stop_codon:yes gene_type:complete